MKMRTIISMIAVVLLVAVSLSSYSEPVEKSIGTAPTLIRSALLGIPAVTIAELIEPIETKAQEIETEPVTKRKKPWKAFVFFE